MKDSQLSALLTPILEHFGLELEDIDVMPAGKRRLLRVVVDGDGPDGRGPLLDDIAEATRAISALPRHLRRGRVRRVHPRGVLPGHQPTADRCAALAPQPGAAGQGRPGRRLVGDRPDRRLPTTTASSSTSRARNDGSRTPRWRRRSCRWSSTGRRRTQQATPTTRISWSWTRRARRRSEMDIDMSVLRLMEREKDLPLDLLVRGHRGGPDHRVRQDRRCRGRRPGAAGPQVGTRRGDGARGGRERRDRRASTTARPTASAGSPRRRLAR